MNGLDPRRNAFRPDLADAALAGSVEAARFIAGEPLVVAAPLAPLRRAPSDEAPLDTEALRGEELTVFETSSEGWAWVQLRDDGYVGWIPRAALAEPDLRPTHKVSALRAFVFPLPDIKAPPLAALPFGARVAVTGEAEDANGRYALIAPEGAMVTQHLAPLDHAAADPVVVAERFTGTPYLWGGKTSLGLDCSGLVQVALAACGVVAPRDSDMQAAETGDALPLADGMPALRRGDLVFWRGHVGFMSDGETLLHANLHHMQVASEPLAAAEARYGRRGLEITTVRRLRER